MGARMNLTRQIEWSLPLVPTSKTGRDQVGTRSGSGPKVGTENVNGSDHCPYVPTVPTKYRGEYRERVNSCFLPTLALSRPRSARTRVYRSRARALETSAS